MTYNEWRDELKNNLLCVSESERRRVLDYYAEAYADRREAGFSEREIIEEFGAPYDAAQRILDNRDDGEELFGAEDNREAARERKKAEREERKREKKQRRGQTRNSGDDAEFYQTAPANYPQPKKKREDYTWLFVLLCIACCIPLFGLIISMVGVTIGLCVSPVIVVISGAATAIGSVIAIALGNVGSGLCALGTGIIILGVGIILCPLFFKLVVLMWKAFDRFFTWLKNLFSGKEA